MEERRESDEMTRLEKQNALSALCHENAHDESCPLYSYCKEVEAPFFMLSDAAIDRLYEDYIIKPQCEINLKNAEEQLGFKFNMPQCDEVTKMINERGDQKAKADEKGAPKKKVIVIINGRGGVGKDTCVSAVARRYVVMNCSSITPIKSAADMLGWDTCDKSDKARKFLSDLKLLSSEFNDYPFTYMMKEYEEFKQDPMLVMFIHIREPEEISKFKERVPECKTLLIKSRRVERGFGNPADDNVDNYDYDYIYHNDKTLEEVTTDFLSFFEKHVMAGG